MTDGYMTNTISSIAYNTHSVQWVCWFLEKKIQNLQPFIAFVLVVLKIFIVVMCVCIFHLDKENEETIKKTESKEEKVIKEDVVKSNKSMPTIYEHETTSSIEPTSIYIAVDDDGYGRSSITQVGVLYRVTVHLQLSHPTSSIVMSQRQSSSANVELVPGVPPTELPQDIVGFQFYFDFFILK